MVYSLVASLDEIANAIGHAFRWLIGYLSTLVYNLIIIVYDLFEYLARAEIINNSFVQEIYRKVGFLLGLFMLFKLIFSLIQSLIDPNKLNDKKNGYAKILIRCVISIVLLGITPTIFREAYQLQNLLIGGNDNSDNVLYKLIIGSSDTGTDSFGRVISTEAYFAFYRDDEFPFLSNSVDTTSDSQYSDSKIGEIKSKIRTGEKNFNYAQQYLNYNNSGVYTVEFNELLSLVFGVGILWMLVVYCIQVAVRVFQLAYLQIVAPVPILSYISDPEGSFSKWLKQCASTFLDLFIRLAIIYFVIYFANHIMLLFEDNNSILASSTGLDPNNKWMWALLEVFLILGLLIFAKKVPDLIKEIFPSSGGAGKFSFGLNPKKEIFDPIKSSPITKGLSTITSPIGLLARKTIGGIDSAKAGYGFGQGWKNNRGKFGTWINKQRETYTPYSYEQSKNKVAGAKEVKEIDTKWNKGVDVAKELMKNGFGAHGTAHGWDKALDGATRSNYDTIFKHSEFVTSKINLDKAKKDLDALRDGLLQVQSGGTFTYGGVLYNTTNVSDLSKKYNSQNGMVSGLESVHNSIRKQYADDAKTEDTYKFIKNNAANPAAPGNTHTTKGI